VPLSGVDPDGLTYTQIQISYSPGSSKTFQASGTVSYTPPGGSAGNYTTSAYVEAIPGTDPIEGTSGTMNINGQTFLAATTRSQTNQLVSSTYDDLTISMDPTSGKITVAEASGQLSNSSGALNDVLAVTFPTNNATVDVIKAQINASGDGSAGGFITITLTAE
jgi:hypothetical protein